MQAWLEEQPECSQLENLESVEDRERLVDRCDKQLKAFGTTTVALSKQVGVSENLVNFSLARVQSLTLLKCLLSVE
jgi:hypothetical protein